MTVLAAPDERDTPTAAPLACENTSMSFLASIR
jgi:hypothetical protein